MWGMKMDVTGSESYPVASFGISCAEPSGFIHTYRISSVGCETKWAKVQQINDSTDSASRTRRFITVNTKLQQTSQHSQIVSYPFNFFERKGHGDMKTCVQIKFEVSSHVFLRFSTSQWPRCSFTADINFLLQSNHTIDIKMCSQTLLSFVLLNIQYI
jgi:hypothetical protein